MNNGHLKPFMCYFCNQTILNETEQGHRSTCGSLLEPCPNKCGAYIQRSLKGRHLKECPNKPIQYRLNTLPSNVSSNRSSTEMKRAQRYSMDAGQYSNDINAYQIEEVALLRKKLQNLELLCKNLSQNLSFMKTKNEDSIYSQQSLQQHNKLELEKVLYQNQVMVDWKRLIESQIDSLKQDVRPLSKMKSEIEGALQNVHVKISGLENLHREMAAHREAFLNEQIYNRDAQTDFRDNIGEMKDFFAQENAVMAAIWNDHKIEIDALKEKCLNMDKTMDEQKAKHASVVFDVRTVMGISSETSEKVEIQTREVEEMKKELGQLKFDMEILEDVSSQGSLVGRPGHLVWKLSNFEGKMESAKENNMVLKSPIFYSDCYGYKIRLLVYLNGIKKWKGRHLIACIHVMSGEFDQLLTWPCNIEGTVVLRDLQNPKNPKDYSKFITAKRNSGGEENEDPQESSAQYIFIPHTTLTKSNFLKDDTVFLEIRINSLNRRKEETNL